MNLISIWKEKGLSILKTSKLLSIPRSTYYNNLKRDQMREKRSKGRPISKFVLRFIYSDGVLKKEICPDALVKGEILNLFSNEFVCYGYHKVTWFLKRKGYLINHKKVYRLMKELRLLRPKLIKSNNDIQRIKHCKVISSKPNEVWEIDIKYIYIHGERRNYFLCI